MLWLPAGAREVGIDGGLFFIVVFPHQDNELLVC